jgi:hypothetical protein
MRLRIDDPSRMQSCSAIVLVVGSLLTVGAVIGLGQTYRHPQRHLVKISYYGYDGDLDFSISPNGEVRIGPEDSITYYTDDPGTLILQLDDGTVYRSAGGKITLSAKQLSATTRVRCSMVLPDGSLIGWALAHEDRYGGQMRVEREPRKSTQNAPISLQATPGDGKVLLSWGSSNGSSSYSVKRATVKGGPYVKIGLATTTSFTDAHVTNEKPYYYIVTGVNSSGEGSTSNEASAKPMGESKSKQ